MLRDFTAIDFETANRYPTSACSIGIVVVQDGEITEEFSHLIKPEPYYFNKKFTWDYSRDGEGCTFVL